MCVPRLQIHDETLPSNGIWEVISVRRGHMSGALMNAITLVRVMRAFASYLFLPCEDIRRQQFAIQKNVLTRTQSCWQLDLKKKFQPLEL